MPLYFFILHETTPVVSACVGVSTVGFPGAPNLYVALLLPPTPFSFLRATLTVRLARVTSVFG